MDSIASRRYLLEAGQRAHAVFLTLGHWLHTLRIMLGRIPSAATVAALPWAGVLVAATSGSFLWIVLGSIATMAVLLWGFAPHIPHLRSAVPEVRHVSQLEEFWQEGDLLKREIVETEDDLADWLPRQKAWSASIGDWIEARISKIEAERFRRPGLPSVSYASAFNEAHNQRLMLINVQLTELIRLRDGEEAKLK